MKSFAHRLVLASLGIAASSAFAAEPCDNPYLKTVPFKKTLSAQNIDLTFFNEARFAYDCQSLLADNRGGINLAFYKLNADILSVQASATQGEQDAEIALRTLLLGFEVAQERKSLGSIFDKTYHTNQDIDVSRNMIVQVGPLPVQVRYGVEGSGKIRVTAGLKKIGTQIGVIPSAKVRAYVQAGTDVQIIEASARGELEVLNGKLDTSLSAQYKSKERRHGARLSAVSYADFSALEGSVTAKLEAHTGKEDQKFEKELFSWPGQKLSGKIVDFSQDVVFTPETGKGTTKPNSTELDDEGSVVASHPVPSEDSSVSALIEAMENR
jgi:hypothetical protein